jgi:hypothetical protein
MFLINITIRHEHPGVDEIMNILPVELVVNVIEIKHAPTNPEHIIDQASGDTRIKTRVIKRVDVAEPTF